MVRSIEVVSMLTLCALLHSVCDLNAAQMILQRSLIWKLIHNEFEMDHNTTKNIYCEEGECAVDHSKVTRCFKRFGLGCKNLNDQASSNGSKTVYFMAMHKNSE